MTAHAETGGARQENLPAYRSHGGRSGGASGQVGKGWAKVTHHRASAGMVAGGASAAWGVVNASGAGAPKHGRGESVTHADVLWQHAHNLPCPAIGVASGAAQHIAATTARGEAPASRAASNIHTRTHRFIGKTEGSPRAPVPRKSKGSVEAPPYSPSTFKLSCKWRRSRSSAAIDARRRMASRSP